MKRVGIITFYDNQNYGNRLQNLAVQTILEEYGFKAESIVFIDSRYKWRWRTLAFRKYFQGMILGNAKASRIYHFQNFDKKYAKTKYLFKTGKTIPVEQLSNYDYFVTGSDQVWNLTFKIVVSNEDFYFLTFTEDDKKICISPSIGDGVIPEGYKERVRQLLSGFRYLSCREKQGAQVISRITGRECEWLIDPTLFVSQEQWKNVFSLKESSRSPYIFLYFLDGISNELSRHIEEYAAAGGYTIINPSDLHGGFYGIDPAVFIELLTNARMVFTDSFHVTAFSINFHVPFYVFDRNIVPDMSSRIESVCEAFCLKNRYVHQQKSLKIQETCDFEAADRQLIAERRKFAGYLEKCFG